MDSFAEKNVEGENEGRHQSDSDRQPTISLITDAGNLNEIPDWLFLCDSIAGFRNLSRSAFAAFSTIQPGLTANG
ncbi:hypothetical protein CEE69_21270 [Rhodopirellula bahusiensis]|uniref:Uncharacterized protein n=1 Tax=Rhodopirellula bahusiensis TaxID=2014065 RepID=A0A2G1W2P3_9BACT|nr:hypothetical protein CEE69_21270 [Rhodopirellula bahusiensis]